MGDGGLEEGRVPIPAPHIPWTYPREVSPSRPSLSPGRPLQDALLCPDLPLLPLGAMAFLGPPRPLGAPLWDASLYQPPVCPGCPLQDMPPCPRPPELPRSDVSPYWSPTSPRHPSARACWVSPPGCTTIPGRPPPYHPPSTLGHVPIPTLHVPWVFPPGHGCPLGDAVPHLDHPRAHPYPHPSSSPAPPCPQLSLGHHDLLPSPTGPAAQAGSLQRRLPRAGWQDGRVVSQITHPSRLVGHSSGGEVQKHQLDTRVRNEPGGGGGGGGPVSEPQPPPICSLLGVPGWVGRSPSSCRGRPGCTPARA